VCCVLCRMGLGYVVVWQHVLGVACVLCAVQNGTEWRVCCVLCRMGLGYVVVWQHVLGVACVFSQAQYKHPDDGRRPKHVGAMFM
jgi:hypothetical protein